MEGDAELKAHYERQWLDLKHLLNAKHFSGPDLARTGQVYDKRFSVGGTEVRVSEEPPLKKFLKTPRLKEDLAKYLDK